MDQRASFAEYAITPALGTKLASSVTHATPLPFVLSRLVALLFVAYASITMARPPGEPPARPVGIVDQPCATTPIAPTPPANETDKTAKDWRERILDPSEGRDFEPPEPSATSAMHAAEEERLRNDWAQLCHYKAENAALHRATGPRVVFMGDSITELWKLGHPEFFGENYIDRGISGQTTGQMLVRFRQDVIALKPVVVHILAGTNDIAGNGGPTTLEAIKNNIASMVDLAIANDIRVVLGSVPPAGMFPWRPSVQDAAQHIVEMNEWLRRFARERNVIYVDYHEPLADERDAMKQTFSNDGVHPNRDGYSVMEPLTRHAIEQALVSAAEPAAKGTTSKPSKGKETIKH
jgi:lysophospholipase L1-like esterase